MAEIAALYQALETIIRQNPTLVQSLSGNPLGGGNEGGKQ